MIVLSLGLELLPGVQTIEMTKQSTQEPTKKKIEVNFNGIMILPNYTEQLLFSESMIPSETYPSEAMLYSKNDQPTKNQNRTDTNCGSETFNDEQLFFSTNDKDKKCCSSHKTLNQ